MSDPHDLAVSGIALTLPKSELKPLHQGPQLNDPQREADKLTQVAHDFEALLVKQIFASMRGTMAKETKGFGESMFTGMLDEQLAQHVADAGGLGLSDALTAELRFKAQVSAQGVDDGTERGGQHDD